MMKERPIIFSSEMVKAILEGRKMQTRRVIKPQPNITQRFKQSHEDVCKCIAKRKCPYGQVGDRLWVRESFCYASQYGYDARKDKGEIWYRASDSGECDGPWKPSIHMPRWASRITLEITDVRVERLQEISEEDAFKEGCDCRNTGPLKLSGPIIVYRTNKAKFQNLWNSIHKKEHRWEDNCWVWVITFERTTQ